MKIQKTILLIFFLTLFCTLPFSMSIMAQDNADCLSCHEDQEMTMEKLGKIIPLGVNERHFNQGAHSKVKCISCHIGFDPYDIPHKANITPVDCKTCHKQPEDKHLFHPRMGKGFTSEEDVNCKNCHEYHYTQSSKVESSPTHFSNLTETCGKCHTEYKSKFMASEHFKPSKAGRFDSPNCLYCHTQPVTKGFNIDKKELKVNQMNLCLNCHLSHSAPQTESAKRLLNFDKSVHGAAVLRGVQEAPVCADCHNVHEVQKADNPKSKIHKFNVANLCGKCHISITNEFHSSIHGVSLKQGNFEAPTCTNCHGEHNVVSVDHLPESIFQRNHISRLVFEKNKMVFCVECHSDENIAKKFNMNTIEKAHDWIPHLSSHWESVHCIDCHASNKPPNQFHNILPPEKTVSKCEECHSKSSSLMSMLYKHEKEKSREKYGPLKGIIYNDVYVTGLTNNLLWNTLSLAFVGLFVSLITLHGFLRWYFTKLTNKSHINDDITNNESEENKPNENKENI